MDSLHVLFSDEGHPVAIRKWSQEPFEGGEEYVRKSDLADLIAACDAVLDWADANARWFDISTAPWEEGVEFEICHAIEIERITVKIINGEAWEGCEPCDLAHFTHWRPVPPPPSNPPLPEPIEALGAVVRKIKGGE